MDRPLKARVIGFSIFAALALVVLPWWFAEPVDPRGGIQSQFGPQPVVREIVISSTPQPMQAVPAARETLPVAQVSGSTPVPTTPQPSRRPSPTAAPTPKPSAPRAPSAENSQRWRLQLASYTDEASAQKFVQRLRTDGIEARIYEASSGGRKVWRVGFDFRATRKEANAALKKLNKRYRVKALLTALD